MARRDGTGPVGQGPLTGRGLGVCNGGNNYRNFRCGGGRRMGMGMGMNNRGSFGRGAGFFQENIPNSKELLSEEKELLTQRLNSINEELEGL